MKTNYQYKVKFNDGSPRDVTVANYALLNVLRRDLAKLRINHSISIEELK